MRSNDEPPAERPQWPRRLLLALGVTLAQTVVFLAVFMLFWMLMMNTEPQHEDDQWAGVEYFLIGLAASPIAAAVTGAVTAARVRLPLFGLYALPVLLGLLSFIAPVFPNGRSVLTPSLLIFIGGNLLIAAATARRPQRQGIPRVSDRGLIP
jgi:hypothetical protein